MREVHQKQRVLLSSARSGVDVDAAMVKDQVIKENDKVVKVVVVEVVGCSGTYSYPTPVEHRNHQNQKETPSPQL